MEGLVEAGGQETHSQDFGLSGKSYTLVFLSLFRILSFWGLQKIRKFTLRC